MKIKKAIEIINGMTSTVSVKESDDFLRIYHRDLKTYNNWFLEMPIDATNWDSICSDWDCLSNIEPRDLARVMDVIQRLLDTPVEERFPEKKYCLEAVRHYSGPIAEKGYVKNVVCKSDYSGFEYSPVPFEFTEKELETMKKNDPVLAPAIDAMKEPVEGKTDDND